MRSLPYHNLIPISPSRSTPSLDHDGLDEVYSPPDDYLATPDLSEWKEIRRLEDQKLLLEAGSPEHVDIQYDLPTLDILSHNQRPLLSELPLLPPPWPHLTIAPQDAFPDYAEVRRFLQEQARPSSPSAFSSASSSVSYPQSPFHDHDLLYDDELHDISHHPSYNSPLSDMQSTPFTSSASPPNVVPPLSLPRRVGTKAKRVEDDDYVPASKRRLLAYHSTRVKARAQPQSDVEDESEEDEHDDTAELVNEPAEDDESGDFRPARRLSLPRPKPVARSSVRPVSSTRRRPPTSTLHRVTTTTRSKSNRGEVYQEGPCHCRDAKCTNCQMTCFYIFVHGQRKGEVCKRLFESGRHLDLRRHKATHAVQEWKWLEDGEITPDMAHWHFNVFSGKEHGLICPNGDCATTFTRYDALKRHMERGTCHYTHLESDKDGLDNRQIKASIIRESNEKYGRITAAKHP